MPKRKQLVTVSDCKFKLVGEDLEYSSESVYGIFPTEEAALIHAYLLDRQMPHVQFRVESCGVKELY